ncbi:sce7726 family protein [Gelidibacter salicanalis]|uniref:Sce7726 family protein n=1 Tax=Gelidibacter salicanalis TaxID=291193 RepID=A0A934KVD1_9FLAO|nr:sce7726 family protein [Gelidibacter salicanalis]MBJ7882026.1 sce7726 family protein [Gelidibacter salicanalis]
MEIATDISKIRSLSQIISPSNFKKIVREGDCYSTFYKIKKHITVTDSTTNLDAINVIYNSLLKNYRNEYVYKNILTNKLLLKKYSLKNTIALNEFNIGKSIADFVLLNGEARVYEIKTELDNLEKLDKQILDYCKFGDKVYIVTSSKYINKLMELYVNSTLGIVELTSRNSLKTVKEAKSNVSTFNYETLFKTLRKQEYLDLIEEYYKFIPDVSNTRIFRECLNLAKEIEISLFQKLVIRKLKSRNISHPKKIKDKSIPDSLKHICYTLDFSENEYVELKSFLNKNSKICISHI